MMHHTKILNVITERIRKIREESLNAVNRLSAERGLLITEFYRGLSATHD